MAYSVDLTTRASRDLARLYRPYMPPIPNRRGLGLTTWKWPFIASTGTRQEAGRSPRKRAYAIFLLYGKKPHLYRIINGVDERRRVVTVVHIRYAARKAYTLEGRVSLPHGRDQRLRRGDRRRESSGGDWVEAKPQDLAAAQK